MGTTKEVVSIALLSAQTCFLLSLFSEGRNAEFEGKNLKCGRAFLSGRGGIIQGQNFLISEGSLTVGNGPKGA